MSVRVSVVVPVYNGAETLADCLRALENQSLARGSYEVIVVDDGSVDDTPRVLGELQGKHAFLRVARHRSQRGIADALRTGYLMARGQVLVFYPADLQFKPADIPRLVAPVLNHEADLVTGFKQGDYDKAFVSGVYNRLSRMLFNVRVRDLNSVKAYRREVMDALPVRPDWHRYMVAIAAANGFSIAEVPVPLYPRHAGKSKFATWHRIPVGVLDMLSVWFELRFGQKPLLAFGLLGAGIFALGALAGLAAVIALFTTGFGVRWVWTIIQTCLILGSVFFAAGFVGEQIAGLRSALRDLRRRLDEITTGDSGK